MIGKDPRTFELTFADNWFRKNDIIKCCAGVEARVIKVYDFVWWRRLLIWLGFKTKCFTCKVIPHDK